MLKSAWSRLPRLARLLTLWAACTGLIFLAQAAAAGDIFRFGAAGPFGSTAGKSASERVRSRVPSPSGPSAAAGNASMTSPRSPGAASPPTDSTAGVPAATTTLPPPTTTTSATPPAATPRNTSTPPSISTPPPAGLVQGAFVSGADPAAMASFAAVTHTAPTIATDYLSGGSGWSGMDGADGGLNWLLGPWAGSGDTLSLGVPIIPTDPAGPGRHAGGGRHRGLRLLLRDPGPRPGRRRSRRNAYLRLGWEFDGSWFPWAATSPGAEASYAAYFAQIVTAMRSVPGAAFRFVWNPDAGAFTTPGYSVSAAYPGDAYVDVIGLDAYDQTWATPQTPANAWSSTTLPSLVAAQQFASAHAKPLALTEWGLSIRSDGHGLGDDPYYVDQMVSWMENPSNDVAYEAYFDCDAGGTNSLITGGLFPDSLARFTADLG